jgi:hypothetical protein
MHLITTKGVEHICAPFRGREGETLGLADLATLAFFAATFALPRVWPEGTMPAVVLLLYGVGTVALGLWSASEWMAWRAVNRDHYRPQALRRWPLGVRLGREIATLLVFGVMVLLPAAPRVWHRPGYVVVLVASVAFFACLAVEVAVFRRYKAFLAGAMEALRASRDAQQSASTP